MHIAILGSRGIPNAYGGFEQFADLFSVKMVERGHRVTVFSSSLHPYKEKTYKGVNIIHCSDWENRIGTAGQFIYDFNCIRAARKIDCDILLQLGYTSSSVWAFMLPEKPIIATNMDGMEWKRSKYSTRVQRFLKKAEAWAIHSSDYLIADNPGIADYLKEAYGVDSFYIPYGAEIFTSGNEEKLSRLKLKQFGYNMILARMEPENHIEEIIRAHVSQNKKLIVVGGTSNDFGSRMKENYASEKIIFNGGIYDQDLLNNLRYFSHLYFHGHSVGGTNPSLLEAMASQALICAHDNVFNRYVLGNDAFYFKNAQDIEELLAKNISVDDYNWFITENIKKIETAYSWDKITADMERLFTGFLEGGKRKK